MTPQDIDAICGLVYDLCGIALDSSKDYLIESRLAELVKREGCANYVDFAVRARNSSDNLKRDVVNAITTRETLFFRDKSPFEALMFKAIPELVDEKSKSAYDKRIRIWSAACSTGQEPYSIAMTLMETLPDFRNWNISILATDISDDAIDRASRGLYPPLETSRGLESRYLNKYFTPQDGGHRIKDEVRAMVSFEKVNLLQSFVHLGRFDIVFCRNAIIYFNAEDRRRTYLNLANQVTDNGYLFVGSSESLIDLGPKFQPQHHCKSVFYQPNRQLPDFILANKVGPAVTPATPVVR
ncbi:CheR family methyltransferase [Blastopirellula marina]|uniref:protein-glutamate O-methyltransferase n=1 Tax=Blastopirellula marina DSM 3645 TaxID=314230 RepID=A3ZLD9_9BACT|nr:protein-glutamate O-methyltransferase CheR [Blastopirellula marina]EAQ82572.1 chemotaxis protein methyltransferase CheR-like protein [Blastopirellula marina DSM 3645]